MNDQVETIYLRSADSFLVVLTVTRIVGSGGARCHVSVRSETPRLIGEMLQVHAIWRDWLRSCVDGTYPAFPSGWRVIDGTGEGATSPAPDLFH